MRTRIARIFPAAAWATALATGGLLFLGALVTSTGSGLSVPDWPTTFGVGMFDYPLAKMAGGVVFEHSHRLAASCVGLATAILAIGVGFAETRRWMKGLAALALLAVVAQGVLGGMTVLLGLPRSVSVLHALLGQTFFAMLLVLATASGAKWRAARDIPRDAPLAGLFGALSIACLVQIGLGAWLRHDPAGLATSAVTRHIFGAVAVYLLVGLAAARAEAGPPRRIAMSLALLGVVQILLGFASMTKTSILVRSIHLVLGATIYGLAVVGFAWTLRSFRREMTDLAVLGKFRLVSLVGVTAAAGFLLEAGPARFGDLVLLVSGTMLLASGAAAANEVIEADSDARMERTKDRPVAAGRISPRAAAGVSLVASVLGLLLLAPLGTLVVALGLLAWVSYVALYTPLKRASMMNTLVGAIPGALPILMGAACGASEITPMGLNLFALLYVWQIPHFLAVVWLYREEWEKAGFVMLGAGDGGASALHRQAVLGTVALLPLSLLPAVQEPLGPAYLLPAAVAGILFVAAGIGLAVRPSATTARGLFRYSLAYCPAVLLLLFLERWF